ncbi:unnamed protein product [Prorocentrum cordatum]|uniref:PPPDE domain-containing protein n=1 Tax=Prorocentrum cordatum TaxID=2364126 RepID=A0ABN9QSN4_9DINO|nr:unnamed protein product [Polarella glacialis]
MTPARPGTTARSACRRRSGGQGVGVQAARLRQTPAGRHRRGHRRGLPHGVVVLGQEFAFGGHDEPGRTGVFRTMPELNPQFSFYQRLIMGHVEVKDPEELKRKVKSLLCSTEWCGPCYDVFEHNCNHFTSDLCWALLGKRPPDWINATAVGLSRSSRSLRVLRQLLEKELQQYVREQTGAPPAQGREPELQAPGGLAFSEEFRLAFQAAWRERLGRELAAAARCADGQDPDRLKQQAERRALLAAAAAARESAAATARAARRAEAARAEQPEAALAAWDAAWRRLSSPIVLSWRAAALRGDLRPEGERERDAQVAALLETAAARTRPRPRRRALWPTLRLK